MWCRPLRPCGEALHQPAGDGRREQRGTVADEPDGVGEVVGGDVLEQEAARPGAERGVDVLV